MYPCFTKKNHHLKKQHLSNVHPVLQCVFFFGKSCWATFGLPDYSHLTKLVRADAGDFLSLMTGLCCTQIYDMPLLNLR